ncbi:MAG: hypothetical protein B7Y99_00155 [Caulobacterales bacterium 32-69-10]|nr:MAG: hypothetical protein B7Y99_00155 [Caulobacterales bacterium 32-69-10]
MVEKIGTVGITEHGEHFGMELMFVSGERAAVMFPHDMFQRLLAVLMGAGAAAYSAQIARLGSEERVLVNSGSEAFRPTDFEFGRGRDLAGANILLMRFKKDRLPVFDIALPFDVAGTFAQELLAELAKDGSKPKTLQ